MIKDIPTRMAYGDALVEMGRKHKDIVVFEADISTSTQTCKFAKAYPERFFNMGIAEQNMMGAAAGISTTGLVPFVSTYAVFASMKACEQIRTSMKMLSALGVFIIKTGIYFYLAKSVHFNTLCFDIVWT